MACRRCKLRIIKPAPMSKVSDRAISETTSELSRRLRPDPLDAFRPPALSVSFKTGLAACSAGARPNIAPVTTEINRLKPSTRASIVSLTKLGNVTGLSLIRKSTTPQSEQYSQRASDERQQQAFGQQLSNQPSGSSAERQPDGHFRGASGGSLQLQIGDVGAGHEQHATYSAQQNPERQLKTTEESLVKQCHARAAIPVRVRISLFQPAHNRVHLRLGLRQSHAGFDASDGGKPALVALPADGPRF